MLLKSTPAMNVKLAMLSVLTCLVVAYPQSVHLHPSGTKIVFQQGTNSYTTDRRQCWGRINQFQSELNGLRGQLEIARKWVRDYPPRITMLEQELETLRLHLKLMDVLGVTNTMRDPTVAPPLPPGMAPLPLSPGVQSGLPPSQRPELFPVK